MASVKNRALMTAGVVVAALAFGALALGNALYRDPGDVPTFADQIGLFSFLAWLPLLMLSSFCLARATGQNLLISALLSLLSFFHVPGFLVFAFILWLLPDSRNF